MNSSSQEHDRQLAMILSSLSKYKNLRLEQEESAKNATITTTTRRVHNLDIVTQQNNETSQGGQHDDDDDEEEEEEEIALCHIVNMNWHTMRNRYGILNEGFLSKFAQQGMAAIALALEHLNTGNGTIVPELDGLNERCNVRFTVEYWDTAGDEIVAVNQIIKALDRNPNDSNKDKQPLPCGFIGSFKSDVSIPTSLLTGMNSYPQVSPTSMSDKLDDKETHPLFARVLPPASGIARPTLDYLYYKLNVQHLVVIHSHDSFLLSLREGFVTAAKKYYTDMIVKTISIPELADESDYEQAAERLYRLGYRYIYAAVDVVHFEPLITAAYKYKVAGNGNHNWLVHGPDMFRYHLLGKEFKPESAMGRASIGLTCIYINSIPGTGRYDQLVQALTELGTNEADLEFIQSNIPRIDDMNSTYDPKITQDLFRRIYGNVVNFYDAAILLGLSACGGQNSNTTSKNDNYTYLDGYAHYKSILQTKFTGASGYVELDPTTGSRNPLSSVFVADVVVPRTLKEDGNSNVTFELIPTATYNEREWFIDSQRIFNDGTSTIPLDLPEQIIDYQHIGPWLRSCCFFMSAVVIVLSFGFMRWTQANRKARVVRSSQPFFLHLICLGTLLMGSSIIPAGLDDEIISDTASGASCMTYPWLLSFGWVVAFSAIFTKTRRIVKVLHNPRFRRITVTVSDVLKPMVALLFVNFSILLFMTVFSPYRWDREVVDLDEYGRDEKSKGDCVSDNSWPYICALIAVDLGTLAIAVYHAYKARNISTAFAESESIGKAIGCILVVSFVGLPVLQIAGSDRKAYFFVFSSIVFVVCMSLLLFIFAPKIGAFMRGDKFNVRESIPKSRVSSHATWDMSVNGSMHGVNLEKSDGTTTDITNYNHGFEILEHPKMKEDLEAKVIALSAQNVVLKERVEELENLVQAESS